MSKSRLPSTEEAQRKILDVIVDDPMMIFALKDKYITEDLWIYCIQREPSIFKHIKHPSLKICYHALYEDGLNIRKLRKKGIRITPDMVYVAVRSTPRAILYVPQRFVSDELKEWAFEQDPFLIKEFRHDIREEYIIRKIKETPSFIQYIWCPKDDWLELAISEDPNVVAYIPELSNRIKKFLQERYPEWYVLLSNRDQK